MSATPLLKVLPLENRIIKGLKERDRESTLTGLSQSEKDEIRREFIKLF